eukprot:g6928.t1
MAGSALEKRFSMHSSSADSLDSREHTMEWKLPSEEQAYERLPWTRGRLFNFLVSTVIFMNTVWLGLETDTRKHRNRYNWNVFDFLLVVLSILDTFVLEYISGSTGSLSALRVLRVLRVARVLRLLRFFRPLWLLVIGAVDAMRALLWAWVLISILIYIFAILLTRTVGFPHMDTDADIEQYFGNIVIVFVAFLLITTFSIMNMIVSVIVDSTLEAALDQKLQAMRDQEYQTTMAAVKVDEVFRRADGNGDGQITKEHPLSVMFILNDAHTENHRDMSVIAGLVS